MENSHVRPNDQAFPLNTPEDRFDYQEGLTKREWFAGMALGGIIGSHSKAYAVKQAIEAADLLIKELNKETKDNG